MSLVPYDTALSNTIKTLNLTKQNIANKNETIIINGKEVIIGNLLKAIIELAGAYAREKLEPQRREVGATPSVSGISTQEKDQLLKYISCLESLAISGFKPQASSFGRRRRY